MEVNYCHAVGGFFIEFCLDSSRFRKVNFHV